MHEAVICMNLIFKIIVLDHNHKLIRNSYQYIKLSGSSFNCSLKTILSGVFANYGFSKYLKIINFEHFCEKRLPVGRCTSSIFTNKTKNNVCWQARTVGVGKKQNFLEFFILLLCAHDRNNSGGKYKLFQTKLSMIGCVGCTIQKNNGKTVKKEQQPYYVSIKSFDTKKSTLQRYWKKKQKFTCWF